MVNIPPFFESGPASDPAYEAVRDSVYLINTKSFVEQLWADYWPPSDPHFLRESKIQFHQRTWELYLWHVLKLHGHAPQKFGPKGPDMWFQVDSRKVWVEAIAPQAGNGQDAVPPVRTMQERIDMGEEDLSEYVPEKQIILRFTHALDEKLRKYEDYRSSGIIGSTDQYIIAINGHGVTDIRPDSDVPFIIKATIGIGPMTASFSLDPDKPVQFFYQRRAEILKRNEEPISTELFRTEPFRAVSAVLYSPKDIFNVPRQLGSEMYYFHNPLATNPLQPGMFKFCREYRADLEEGRLDPKDWHIDKERGDKRSH